jgi:pyridinium-3,5-biscarboxylic acid mononucleotide sulfurtransferase
LGLPSADRPASPCLASRIVYGLAVTEERLDQVERAEEFLRTLGLKEFRVRHHDAVARIEVLPDDLARVVASEARVRILDTFKSLGFKYVTVDLQGFRSGSLNEALPDLQKHQ